MGGAAGGEFAAQLALDAITRYLQAEHPEESNADVLLSAFREANRIIVLRRHNPDFAGMGTTAVALRFDGKEAVINTIGDTRAYLIRDGAVQQLTVDHTFVQTLVDDGKLAPEDALNHPEAHVLTRCLGSEPNAQIETHRLWLWPPESEDDGDIVLLCSDGLYSLVPDIELGHIASTMPPDEACARLVELARERGGYDNITVSIIPFKGLLKTSPPEASKGGRARQKTPREPSAPKAGIMRHLISLTLMSVLAASATVGGFFVMRFLK
jgi:protein phosphatase